jgi:phosphatidylserine/phosphatidylglycerophosphate/cardiolipin synthase-like enzyme
MNKTIRQIDAAAIAAAFIFVFGACGDSVNQNHLPAEANDPSGKADGYDNWSQCQRDEVLFFLNQKSTDKEAIIDAGVHKRGAGNLWTHRKGKDGQDWTKDDQYFSSIRDVNDVHWVGKAALQALQESVKDKCESAEKPSARTVFSPKPFDESHITDAVDIIDRAQDSLDIAMYSFGTDKILEALKRAEDRGVSIRFIFHEASENHDAEEQTMSNRLEEIGIDVRYVNKIMHHKYMIADGPRQKLTRANEATVWTSSGNWSYGAASKYDENTVIVENDTELTMELQREFNTMWEHSRDFEQDHEYEYFESHDIHKDMIPDRIGIDVHFTSTNFGTYVSNRYGNTFSVDTDKRYVSRQLERLIKSADDSIWVASGHLRYRPVAEALIEKHKAEPNLDIKVYLDNQEYIGEGYYYYLQSQLEDCLDNAEDKDDREECRHSGFYFSYPLHKAGIDVRFKYYAYYWDYTYAKQMHHKYFIIDGDTVASGSYNISQNAEHDTFENVIVYRKSRYPGIVRDFKENFETIWQTNRDKFGQLMDSMKTAEHEVPIRYEPMALTWPEVKRLEKRVEKMCPRVESDHYDEKRREYKSCHME